MIWLILFFVAWVLIGAGSMAYLITQIEKRDLTTRHIDDLVFGCFGGLIVPMAIMIFRLVDSFKNRNIVLLKAKKD
jgi:uncharacterized membrane protein